MKNVLVTGACGRIGRQICVELKDTAGVQDVFKIDNVDAPGVFKINLQANNAQLVEILATRSIDTIFHTAALMKVADKGQGDLNVIFAQNLVRAVAKLPKAKRPTIVNLSSAAELGEVDESNLPATESYKCQPVSDYGVSKHAQTQFMLMSAGQYEFRCICARIFNLTWLPAGAPQLVQAWAIKLKKIKDGELPNVMKVGDLSIRRDFFETDLLSKTLIDLAKSKMPTGIVNVSSGTSHCLEDILKLLMEIMDVHPKIEVDPTLLFKGTPNIIFGDNTKLKEWVDIPDFDLNQNLQRLVESLP